MTIKELQDTLNERLKKFEGQRYEGKASIPDYHKWYKSEIEAALADLEIRFFRVATWKIVAEIDGPGEVRVSFETVASVELDIKRDRRYKHDGPGEVKSILVRFREGLQNMTIEEARVFLLKKDLKARIAYYKGERERLAVELETMIGKIADLEAITIEEAT